MKFLRTLFTRKPKEDYDPYAKPFGEVVTIAPEEWTPKKPKPKKKPKK